MTVFIIISVYLIGCIVAFYVVSKLLRCAEDGTKLSKYDVISVAFVSILSWVTVLVALLSIFLMWIVYSTEVKNWIDRFTDWVNDITDM